MYKLCIPLLIFLLTSACQAQDGQGEAQTAQHVGGPCEGCEAIHEYGDRELSPVDTLPGFGGQGN